MDKDRGIPGVAAGAAAGVLPNENPPGAAAAGAAARVFLLVPHNRKEYYQ